LCYKSMFSYMYKKAVRCLIQAIEAADLIE